MPRYLSLGNLFERIYCVANLLKDWITQIPAELVSIAFLIGKILD